MYLQKPEKYCLKSNNLKFQISIYQVVSALNLTNMQLKIARVPS